MTQLLELAFAKAQKLTEEEQNMLARGMLTGMQELLEAVSRQLRDASVPETTILSEDALSDWNRPEEQEAWQHLQ